MDVLISVDMEGVSGIATVQQIDPAGRGYGSACVLMTAEANAAVAGAFAAGATSVLVADSHGPMDNLISDQLDPRADYVVGSPGALDMIQELTSRTGVLLLVGYHAGGGATAGVLAHSYDGLGFADVRLNGRSITEAELNALIAAAEGVPVGLLTGDDVICALAKDTLPGVITVPVKTALGSTAARCKHPVVACEAIQEGAARAVALARAGGLVPLAVPSELAVEVDLRPIGAAEIAARVPGAVRTGAGTVAYSAAHPREVIDILMIWSVLAKHGFRR
jgi:D-amino peptidase